jgi:hypothetical protein
LLHLQHVLLLLCLCLVSFLENLSDPLLTFQVLRHAAIRARHFSQGKIGVSVFSATALLKA